MIDDLNNLAKNQVSAVFHSRAIRRSVLPKFRELCEESPCLCPSEGHKHGGRHVTKHLSSSFVIEMKKKLLLYSSDILKSMPLLVQAPFS